MTTKKPKAFQFPKGFSCFINSRSPIIAEYFEAFGQPLPLDLIPSACFEGTCISEPFPKEKNKIWILQIPALSKSGNPMFKANQEMLQDQYCCRDDEEPPDWLVQSNQGTFYLFY